jgi:DNA/RNA-binding domain of Phe-tRNA-synthetase-like protein
MMRTKMTFKNILIKRDKSKVHLQNLNHRNSRMTMPNSHK